MSLHPSTEGRGGLTPFRLSDIPLSIRESAYKRTLPHAGLTLQVQLGLACHHPSDRVYWIPTDAWEAVMTRRRRRR